MHAPTRSIRRFLRTVRESLADGAERTSRGYSVPALRDYPVRSDLRR
jgi:hypothetical protein